MFVRDAKALCPQLVIFPYDFKAYEEVSLYALHSFHIFKAVTNRRVWLMSD